MKGNCSTNQGFIFTQVARYVERETVNCSMCLCVYKNICTYVRAIPCVYICRCIPVYMHYGTHGHIPFVNNIGL